MQRPSYDDELLKQLAEMPEVTLCGFSVRQGLAGTGVTVLKGRNYFGSWRSTDREFVWVPADLSQEGHVAETVDEALRYTLLLILRNLETNHGKPLSRYRTG